MPPSPGSLGLWVPLLDPCPRVAQSTPAPLLSDAQALPSPCRYLEAIRRLKAEGKCFARTIHLTFVPGESPGCPLSGGQEGLAAG